MKFAELLNLIPGANMLIPIRTVIYGKSLVHNYRRAYLRGVSVELVNLYLH